MSFNNRGILKVGIPVITLLLLLAAAPVLMAQSQTLSGTVVDSSGAVIPGAQVRIVDAAKGTAAREVTTDEGGRFQAINLQPGAYTLTVELSGFKKSQTSVTLDVNTKLDVGQIMLEVGQVSEVVNVTGEAPAVQTATMEKAYLVDTKQIAELPMNGRNWVALMSTVPGMTSSTQNDFNTNFNDVSGFHALGGRGSQNNFYLDGSPNLDVGDNQSQYTQPSIDSIAEFKVQQSSFLPSTAATREWLLPCRPGRDRTASTARPMSTSATTFSMPFPGWPRPSRRYATTSSEATSAAGSPFPGYPPKTTRSCSSSTIGK